MISFPNAKINLGLNILRKRADGYHDIESCLYPIPLRDVLEIIPSESFSFTNTGLSVDDKHGDNLCIKAFRLLQSGFGLPEIDIHLHKVIPMGAGLGGGSADAAFTLKLLNSLFELDIREERLSQFAAHLGSDCPFFIENKPAYVTGTGTDLQSISVDLKGRYLMLVFPGFPISTAEAYANVKPHEPERRLDNILKLPVSHWKDELKNDFENSLFPKYPELKSIKEELYNLGADYAAMSGSGSTMFGIFNSSPDQASLGYSHKVFEL